MEKKILKQQSPLVTIVTPAYNEAKNIPLLHEQLVQVFDQAGLDWEWIIVDDHSADATFLTASQLTEKDERVRAVRFSRNYGSHMALRCGFEQARGECVIGMAADLQDPPAFIPELVIKWQEGVQVVWAARESRAGEKNSTLLFAHWYYRVMRDVVGLKQMPLDGADFFLIDRRVVDAVNQFTEKNVSLFMLIAWMGFRQEAITYDKQPRQHGKSSWSLEQKLKMAIDSLTSFSYQPIRFMTLIGLILSSLAFIYLIIVLINYLSNTAPPGWTSLMAAILLIGGLQIMMIGFLGEYIWRSLDESRRRPRYTIETTSGHENPDEK